MLTAALSVLAVFFLFMGIALVDVLIVPLRGEIRAPGEAAKSWLFFVMPIPFLLCAAMVYLAVRAW
jgi:hypothetical protein